jgi:hypothetical protein
MLLVAVSVCAASGHKLLKDAEFEKAAALAANPPPDVSGLELQKMLPWHFYVIEAPAEVQYAKGQATLTGGKAFLHSSVFKVEAGKDYQISLEAKGDGKVSVGLMWWKAYGDDGVSTADPHWTRIEEPTKVCESGHTVKATFKASPEATRAYLRLVVTEGSVTVSDLNVVEVKAEEAEE